MAWLWSIGTLALCVAADPAEDKIAAAKKTHGEEVAAFKKTGLEWFEKRLDALDNGNDDKARNALAKARDWFRTTGEPTVELPETLREDFAASARAMERVYVAAIAEVKDRKATALAETLRRQHWEFRLAAPGHPQEELPDGAVCLMVCRCSLMALGVRNAAKPAGAELVQLKASEGDKSQHWRLKHRGQGADRAWSFQHVDTGLWMNVSGGGRQLGGSVILYASDGTQANEQWLPARRGEWLTLEGLDGRRFLAVRGGQTQEGADVIQWSATDRDDQRFKLVPVKP